MHAVDVIGAGAASIEECVAASAQELARTAEQLEDVCRRFVLIGRHQV